MKNLFKARWMTSLIFLILLFVITGIAAPGFLTYDNIITCFNTATMYTLLAVGIAFVIMTGEIDVSIGATLGLTAGMTGLIAQQGGSIPKMLLLCLVTGAAIGLVNGVGVSYFGVPSSFEVETTHSVWYAMTASCSCVSVKVVYLFVAKLAEDTASTHSCTSPALAPASCCGASAAALCCCGAHPDRPAPAMMPRAPVAAIP